MLNFNPHEFKEPHNGRSHEEIYIDHRVSVDQQYLQNPRNKYKYSIPY
jgi:hypothetical protein